MAIIHRQWQAKTFLTERKPKLIAEQLNFDRKAVRIQVGLLTSHFRFSKHMRNLGLEEEETAIHVLCHCDGLTKVRLLQLGREKSRVSEFMKGTLSGLWTLIKRLKLDRVL